MAPKGVVSTMLRIFSVFLLAPTVALASSIDSSFAFRETFLPPGPPSVAMRLDETAILWNPAGLAFSNLYSVGYAWKGIYREDQRTCATQFFLTKARGVGFGFLRDDLKEGVKTTALLSLAPRVSHNLSLGFTGKWRGGFNFDCGAMIKLGRRTLIGVVARNLRKKENIRRYWEGGIRIVLAKDRLIAFGNVVNEDSPWRKSTSYGGGFYVKLDNSMRSFISYTDDGCGHTIFKASLEISAGDAMIEGSYSQSSDDWVTISVRLSNWSR